MNENLEILDYLVRNKMVDVTHKDKVSDKCLGEAEF